MEAGPLAPVVTQGMDLDQRALTRCLDHELANTGNALTDAINPQLRQALITDGLLGVTEFSHYFDVESKLTFKGKPCLL